MDMKYLFKRINSRGIIISMFSEDVEFKIVNFEQLVLASLSSVKQLISKGGRTIGLPIDQLFADS